MAEIKEIITKLVEEKEQEEEQEKKIIEIEKITAELIKDQDNIKIKKEISILILSI